MKDHHSETTLNYDLIDDGIYVGTNLCCQTHFDEELITAGIEADISMEGERLDAPFGVDYYLWLPVDDTEAPTQDQMRLGVSAMKELVVMNKKVYLHCKNGHGRAPTLMAAYLISAKGMGVQEAITFIKIKRVSIHLDDGQVAALEEFTENFS